MTTSVQRGAQRKRAAGLEPRGSFLSESPAPPATARKRPTDTERVRALLKDWTGDEFWTAHGISTVIGLSTERVHTALLVLIRSGHVERHRGPIGSSKAGQAYRWRRAS